MLRYGYCKPHTQLKVSSRIQGPFAYGPQKEEKEPAFGASPVGLRISALRFRVLPPSGQRFSLCNATNRPPPLFKDMQVWYGCSRQTFEFVGGETLGERGERERSCIPSQVMYPYQTTAACDGDWWCMEVGLLIHLCFATNLKYGNWYRDTVGLLFPPRVSPLFRGAETTVQQSFIEFFPGLVRPRIVNRSFDVSLRCGYRLYVFRVPTPQLMS